MAIAYVDSTVGTNTAALPTGTASGDVVVVFTWRDLSTTPPDLPANWTNEGTVNATDGAGRACWRIYDGVWTMPTFTNGTQTCAVAVSGINSSDPVGTVNSNVGNSTTITWNAMSTLVDTSGTSLILRNCWHDRPDELIVAPASHTQRESSGTNPGHMTCTRDSSVDPITSASDTVVRSDRWGVFSLEVRAQTGTAFTESPVDNVGVTDTIVIDRGLSRTEDVGITDSVAKEIGQTKNDAVDITDTVFKELSKAISEAVDITDTVDIQKGRLESPVDTVGITDTMAFDLGLGRSDTVQLSDSVAFDQSYVKFDTVGITDTVSIVIPLKQDSFDTIGITDSIVTELVNTGKESFVSIVDDKREIAIAYLVAQLVDTEVNLRPLSIHDLAFRYWSHKAGDYLIPTRSVEDHMKDFDPTKAGWEWLMDIV